MATPNWTISIEDIETDNLEVTSIQWGYAFPRTCKFRWVGRHDQGPGWGLSNNNKINVKQGDRLVFTGRVQLNSPGGVTKEGVEFQAIGLELLANRYIIQYNKSIEHKYNLDNLADWDSPNPKGARWQVGQVILDILEHACGIPAGGSSIPKHHKNSKAVTDTYMPTDILASWDTFALTNLLKLEMTEVRVIAQRFWDYLKTLVEMTDTFGIFIDPTPVGGPHLVVHDFTTSQLVDFNCGVEGTHVDPTDNAPTPPYNVKDSKIEFNIEPCRTKIIIEGRGLIEEARPKSLGGSDDTTMLPHWQDLTDPNDKDPVTPGTQWIINDVQKYTPFWEGYMTITTPPKDLGAGVTLAGGTYTLMGPVLVLDGVVCHPNFAQFNLDNGTMTVKNDLSGHKLEVWTLYLAPFQVTSGPGGDVWVHYHALIEEGIFDDKLLHPSQPFCTPYVSVGTYFYSKNCANDPSSQQTSSSSYCQPMPPRDDTPLMQGIADMMLKRLGNERVTANVELDGINLDVYTLEKAGVFKGLQKWDTLGMQIMQIEINPTTDTMKITCTNDVFRVPNYSEWKRRFQLRRDVSTLNAVTDTLRFQDNAGGTTSLSRR